MWAVLAVAVLMSVSPGDGKYGRWIEDLGHDDPAVRDAASSRLKAAGRAAWPELESAGASHPDLETRNRCRDLVAGARLRRSLSWRVLDEVPNAVAVLQNGTSSERIALIRVLARAYEDTVELLLDLVQDPDPEVVLAAGEYLQERRNTDWAPRLLEFFAREDCPRPGRVHELLTMASSRLAETEFHRLFADAGPRGRNRLFQLAMSATLPLRVPPEILRDMLEGKDLATRRIAFSWLRERGCPGALRYVEALLSDPEPAVVVDALTTLRACSWRPGFELLEALLSHEDASVREEAVQAALAFEERGCLPALRRLLEDPAISVRQSALNALPRLAGAAAIQDLWAVFRRDSGESRDTAAGILSRYPDAVLPLLRPLLRDADPDTRIRAYDLWARIDNVRVLAPLAQDRDETVRRWALQQLLRRQESPGAVEAVELFAADASEPVRFDALRALVRLERRDHAVALETFLASREYSFRFDAAETLLTLRDDRARTLARKLLEEPDTPLRRLGYFALADRSDRDAADRAIAELGDPDGRLGGAAAKYLRQLLSGRADAAVLLRIARTLESGTGEPLELAFNLIMEFGDETTAPAIRALLASGRAPRPDRAVRALADWAGDRAAAELAGLFGADPSLNDSIAARLREIRKRSPEAGRSELDAALSRLFASPDRRVRRGAAQAAGDLALPLPGLLRLIDDREASARCIALNAARTLGLTEAAAAIEARLDDDDPDVRVAAGLALATLQPGSRPAVDRALAQEDCAWVRRKLAASLAPSAK